MTWQVGVVAILIVVFVVSGVVVSWLWKDGPGGGEREALYLTVSTENENREVPNPLDPGGVAHRLRIGRPVSVAEAHWAADVIQEYGRLLRVVAVARDR